MKLITENELNAWVSSHEQDAQGVTVELTARLIQAQCLNPLQFRFPLGDSIGQHGLDGCLQAKEDCPPYINQGFSIWEIGSNANPGSKLTADYKKRLKQISDPADRSQTTFVFVTPRSATHTLWTTEKQEKWKKKKAADGWKDIKIMDATLLCDWLSRFPAISVWLYQIMTERDCNIETPLTRWEDLEHIPSPGNRHLTPELFLCNREEIIPQVKDFLENPEKHTLPIQTRYPEHLADFIAALVKDTQKADRGVFYDNILILEKAEDLKNFADLQYPHVFILGEDDTRDQMVKLRSRAIKNGHSLIFPRSIGGRIDMSYMVLPMPSPAAIQLALERSEFPPLEAQQLASKSNGNIPCLLRLLGDSYGTGEYWGGPDAQSILAFASLIGQWDERNCADLQVVEAITGKTYEEWTKEIASLPKRAATPLRHRDDGTYSFISRYEGWQIGGSIFSKEDLERFFVRAERIFVQTANSTCTNSFPKALAASDKDKAEPSDGLVSATAEVLAIIAANAEFWKQGSPLWLKERVRNLVESLLGHDNSCVWSHLNDVLPLLAEASPQPFLRRLSDQISSRNFLEGLNCYRIDQFTRNPITGLLWALECLAWFPDWFPQVTALLGDLSQVTLPENSANRPEISLKEIFSLRNPHTYATVESKAKHLTRLTQKYPLIAWKIILAISPYGGEHSISFGTYMPRWRELSAPGPQREKELTSGEWWTRFEDISGGTLNLLLQPGMLPLDELVKGLTYIPQKSEEILKLFADCKGKPEQSHAWETLGKTLRWVGNKKRFGALRDRLVTVVDNLAPSDKYEHLKIYFEEYILNYNDALSYEEQLKTWQQKQTESVATIFHEDELHGVLHLASLVKMHNTVGQELARVADASVDSFLIVRQTPLPELSETVARIFLTSYIAERYAQGKDAWLQKIWEMADDEGKLNTLLSIPFMEKAWDLSKTLPEGLQQAYWQRVLCRPDPTGEDLEYPLQKLIAARRNGDALQWLYWTMRNESAPQPTTLKKLLLNPDESMARHSCIVLRMIEYLQKMLPKCDDELAAIELLWIKLFRSGEKEQFPDYLNRKLLTDPDFFQRFAGSLQTAPQRT